MSGAEERLANDPTSELWGEHLSRYRFATQFARGNRVLDVACGTGFGLCRLEQAGARPVGVDEDAATLGEIRKGNDTFCLIRADGACLPFANAVFDLVVSFETIEHVADARALVLEVRRVLKPGGRLVLSTPNKAFGPPERHLQNPFHVREFTADELRAVLAESFEEVRLFGQRPSPAYRFVPFLMIEPDLSPAALAWKALLRLPFDVRNRFAVALSGRAFYPGADDYSFTPDDCDGAHALLAVAC